MSCALQSTASKKFVIKDILECFVETTLSYVRLVDQEDHSLSYLAGLYSSKVWDHRVRL